MSIAVRAGEITGLQKRIQKRNPKALFVNCDNHSLNLACVHAAKNSPVVITFFGTVDKLYAYFSSSTVRWELLQSKVGITLKRACETRWSSRADAVKVISDKYLQLTELLEEMYEDATLSQDTRSDAFSLQQCLMNFNFVCLLYFWDCILGKINRVQKRLQDPAMNFADASLDLQSLMQEFGNIRDEIPTEAIAKSKDICQQLGIQVTGRIRRRRLMPGEAAPDVGLTAEEEINRILKDVIDILQQEMKTRFQRLQDLDKRFGFLLDAQNLITGDGIDNDLLKQKCMDTAQCYNTDIDGTELFTEIIDCRMLFRTRTDSVPGHVLTALHLLSFIASYGNDVFPNLKICLQIMLTVAVSVASCERSFSKLKLILTYLRSSMSQDRLSNLSVLSIERETVDSIDFNNIIDRFAAAKAAKLCFNLFMSRVRCAAVL